MLLSESAHVGGVNLYAYCLNNPVMYIDETGTFAVSFLVGLLIASVTFAVVNTGTQLVGDLVNYAATGQWNSGWEEYAGAFLGGFAGGATFFLTKGNLKATFAVMGGIETLTTNLMTNATGRTSYSGWQILGNTALSVGTGMVAGAFGGKKVGGITKGSNSFLSVWKGGLTKLGHGTAGRMSARVIFKGFAGVATMRSMAGVYGGFAGGLLDWIKWLFGDQTGIGYV